MSGPLLGCSLDSTEFENVTAGYAQAANRYSATAQYDGDRAFVDVCGAKAPIAALLDDMIAREGGCCAHIQFDVSEIADGYWVALSVPSAPGIAAAALRQAVPAFFPTATILDESAVAAIPTVTRTELATWQDDGRPLLLIEALPEMFYRKVHLPGAINIPLETFDERIAALAIAPDVTVVVYCAHLSCRNSAIAASRLIDLGYSNVFDYAEGKQDWVDAGLPTERVSGNASI